MKHVKVTRDPFDTQRDRLTRLQEPTPATEQYDYWDESESADYGMSTREFAFFLVTGGAIVAMFYFAWIGN